MSLQQPWSVQKILVPVDFSSCSRRALSYAAFWGARMGAQLDVLHVVSEPPSYGSMDVISLSMPQAGVRSFRDYAHQLAKDEMGAFLDSCSLPEGLKPNLSFVDGSPTHSILNVAEEHHYDLIVMGTHGRTGLSHALIGSVAERVLRKAPCPVLTVRQGVHAPAIAAHG